MKVLICILAMLLVLFLGMDIYLLCLITTGGQQLTDETVILICLLIVVQSVLTIAFNAIRLISTGIERMRQRRHQ